MLIFTKVIIYGSETVNKLIISERKKSSEYVGLSVIWKMKNREKLKKPIFEKMKTLCGL